MRGETEVKAFSRAMLRKLALRERHGDWRQMVKASLLEWLEREVEELRLDVVNNAALDEILMEAADVGNLAMMVADRCGALVTEEGPSGTQVGGDHYLRMAITPTQYIVANGIPWMEGNAIKYISRWRAKGGKNDLMKARHYIDLLLESAA